MFIDFRERGRQGDKEKEKHLLVAFHTYPSQESDPFGVQEDAPTIESPSQGWSPFLGFVKSLYTSAILTET